MNKIYSKVYGWLFVGLLLTFATGAFFSNYENAIINLMSGAGYIVVLLVEFGLAIFLSARIHKMSSAMATFCYLLYSFVTGLTFSTIFGNNTELYGLNVITFSTIFIAFDMKSLILIFLVTALVFGLFALFGMFTKLSLDKLGTILFMMLLAIIVASIINIFVGSSMFDLIICIIGILVFIGYIGYDVKKLPILFDSLGEENGAIYGAFQLYLDFINIFIYLVQLFGNNDSK